MASLTYHAGALGDFITALPAIARWQQKHPGERHILLGKPAHASITPSFDEVWDTDSAAFSPLFSGSAVFEPLIVERLRPVASALLFAAPSSPLAASLGRLGVGEILRQDPFPSAAIHVVDYHLSLFGLVDGSTTVAPRLRIPDLAEEPGIGDVTAIHPGSGSQKKNWPFDRFMELAALLARQGQRIAWILGPADAGVESLLAGTGFAALGALWKSLPLPVLAARVARCRLYIGNDSGVTHLAAAAGCPTVALFGGSDSRIWAPRGPRVKIVDSRNNGMEAIRASEVFRACVDFLKDK